MIVINLPLARRLALGVVLGQAAVTFAGALLSGSIAGAPAAVSAALGGGISTGASCIMAAFALGGRGTRDPARALRAFFIGEIAKVAFVIALFVAVLKTLKVVPLAMLGTYIATFLVFWLVLANAPSSLGPSSRQVG